MDRVRQGFLGVCCAMAAVLGWLSVSEGHIVAERAVLTAYPVAVRSQAPGQFASTAAAGARVTRGQVIAHLVAEPVADARLHDAEQRAALRDRELAAAGDELSALTRAWAAAPPPVARQAADVTDELDRRAALDRQRLGADADWREQLQRGAYLPMAEPDFDAARRQELGIRIDDARRDVAWLTAARDEARRNAAAEQARVRRLQSVDVVAPADAVLWSLPAPDGTPLPAGALVAELVECRSAFVAAAIPRNRFADVAIGAEARIRLPDGTERSGRVLSVASGEDTLGNTVASPDVAGMATVRVQWPGTSDARCPVGQAVQVTLPAMHRQISWP